MFYDFIEVSTNFCDAEIHKAKDDTIGLSIGTATSHLCDLPIKGRCAKENIAISNTQGKTIMYYLPDAVIKKYSLCTQLTSASSIGTINSSVKEYIENCLSPDINNNKLSAEDLLKSCEIETDTFENIFNLHGVSGIYLLKINTYGRDSVILENYLSVANNSLLAHRITFVCAEEHYDINKTVPTVLTLIDNCKRRGYELIQYGYDNKSQTILELNINLLKNRSRWTDAIPGYYLVGYPPLYNCNNPPHKNTLESAKEYCMKNGFGGVTFQHDKYEVRLGSKLMKTPMNVDGLSWIFV